MTKSPARSLRRITRDKIEHALQHDQLRRRAETGNITAVAAIAGIPPDALYAEALALGLIAPPEEPRA
ncbi:hypothetical protein ACFVT1_36525 [Streptomyces sp. NPDC057963]|uniref:hypothetical protein n=1 Tax=Streptomyces sp. NPDC057963 TaxID=3346290 RepID=UPI0036EB6516